MSALNATNHYWIGGTGAWNNTINWSLSSGGVGGASIPTMNDDVIFDQHSFFAAKQTVMVTEDAVCHSINWTAIDDQAIFSCASTKKLTVYGSYTLSPLLSNGFKGQTIFSSQQTGNTISTAGKIIVGNWVFDGTGSWILNDDLTTDKLISLSLIQGALFTNDKTINCAYFIGNSTKSRILNLGNSTIIVNNVWDFSSSANIVFNAGTSSIEIKDMVDNSTFKSGSLNYNDVKLLTTFCNPSGTPCVANLMITMLAHKVTCNGLCDGSATVVSVTGGSGSYAYDWQGASTPCGDFTDSICSLCSGNYTVKVTDLVSGLFCFCNITVAEPSVLFDYELFNTQPLCFGNCNGTAAVDATGGTSPYTYLWTSGGYNNDTVLTLCVGTYDVQVTDINGCIGNTSITITQPTTLTSPGSFTNVTCNGACDGTASVVASGGALPYTYFWTSIIGGVIIGQGTPSISNLCPDTYTCTVTDANSCTSTYTATITSPLVLTLTMSQTNASCGGICDGTATASVSGGTPNYTYVWSNGSTTTTPSTTNTISALCAGTYSVTVTDANGCTINNSVIITQPPILVATATGINVTCFGLCNGTATVAVAGGTLGYTYLWCTGATTPGVSGLCPGACIVTVTDLNGCTDTGIVNITQPAILDANPSHTDLLCFIPCNGTATSSPTGGTPSYTYLWSTGATTPGVSLLCPGTYSVTVTDANGCKDTSAAIVVTQPPVLNVGATFTDVTCNGFCNGSALSTPTGGTPSYTYLWSTTATTPGISLLCLGTYTVTVTDANGCTATQTVTITQPNPLSVSISATTLLCFGDCNAIAAATTVGGTGPFTFNWLPAIPPPVGQGTNTITSVCAGSYTVNVTDINLCPATANVLITQPTPLALATATNNVTCFGLCNGSAAAIAGGGTPGYSYLWSTGATTTFISGLCAGTYTVCVTDFNGCSICDTLTITQPNLLLANPTVANNVSCGGLCNGSAISTPTGGTLPYSYDWTPGTPPGEGTDSIYNLCAGTYNVIVTDFNLCTSTQPVIITQPLVLSAPITGSTSSCNICNGTATVTAVGGSSPYTYLWSNGQITPTAVILCANFTYTVTVTDANGCTATNTVTILPTVVITITTSSTTLSCFGACDGIATANPAGGVAPYSYLWILPPPLPFDTTPTISGLCAGSYTVTVTDFLGCFNTDTVIFTNPPLLTVTSTTTNATCVGACNGTATANPVGGTGAYSYSWNSSPVQITQTATALCAGSYTVTVTDANGCTATSSVIITEPPPVIDNVTITLANCLFADGVISVAPTGGGGPYTYNWSPDPLAGDGTSTITGLLPGAYTLDITSGGCTYTFNYLMSNIAAPTTTMSHINVSCNGVCDGTASVVAAGGTPGYLYDWSPGSPLGDLTPAITALCGTITYTVTVTDAAGCITLDTATVINPLPISPNPTIVNESCGGTCDGSIIVVPSGGTGGYTYLWSTGAITPGISLLCAGSYTVTVTDANGCDSILIVTIVSPPLLVVTLDSTNVLCNGACNGTATAVVVGGTGPFTYAWSTGPAFILPTVVGLCPGSYTVTVTDANGCTATDAVTIAQPVVLTSFTSQTNVSCFGLCDGVAIVTANGGTIPYTYNWNAGFSLNDTASGLCPGLYTAIVSDFNGCVSSPPGINITQPSSIIPTASSVNPACNLSCNGTATANPTGGSPGFAGYTYSWAPGGPTQTINSLCAGNYVVTVTDSLGCSNTDNVTLTDPPVLNANASSVAPTCSGGCDGSVTSTPVGGTGPTYTYAWSVPSTLQTVTALCSGNYTVTVTDQNGCLDTQGVAVINPSPINVIIASTPSNCGACDGTITITPTTGLPPYTYVWTMAATGLPPAAPFTGNGTPNVTNVCAGLYNVLVTDGNGCNSTFTIPMNNSSGPTGAVVSTTDATCFGVCNGIGSIDSVIGGTPLYSFLWNDPLAQTNDTAFNLCDSTYFVEITDFAGCIIFIPVTINEPTPILSNAVITDAFCSGVCTGAITVTPSGGTPGYTYAWTPIPITGQGTPTVTGLCPLTYTLTITDASLCSVIDTFIVGQSTPITATIASTSISCSSTCNGMAYINITAGTAPYLIQWNDPLGQTNDTASALCAGNYSVDITDSLGCTLTLNTTITATPTVIANAVITNATCGLCDGQAVLAPSGGTLPYTYLWSNTQTTSTATSLCSGLYIVNITDGAGCITSVSIPVSNTSGPTSATITVTNVSCFGLCDGAVTAVTPVGGTVPYTFLWVASGQTTAAISGLCAGVYYVQITDSIGCSLMDSVTITTSSQIIANQIVTPATCGVCDGAITIAPSCPGATVVWNTGSTALSLSSLCAGVYSVQITCPSGCTQNSVIPLNNFGGFTLSTSATNVTCNGSCNGLAEVNPSGGLSPYAYLWNDVSAQTTDITTATLCAGTYFVQVTGADGCVSIASATITEPTVIGFSVANTVDPLCNGTFDGAITTIPSGGTLSYTYSWTPAPAAGQTTANVTGLNANTYIVTVTDSLSCISIQTITLINPAVLTISNVATNSSCNTIADGAIDVTVGGGTLPYSYLWSGCSAATTEDLTNILAPCTYIITVTDFNLCTIADTIDLLTNQTVIAFAGNDTSFCASGAITLSAAGSISGINYQWFEIPGNANVGNTITISVTPPIGTTCYYVVVDDGTPCSDNDTVCLTANPLPNVSAGPDQTIVVGSSIGIGGNPTTSTPGTTILWNPLPGLDNGTIANPVATPTTTTTYTVTVTSAQGCTLSDSMIVTVLATIVIPDGISPNGDGINDEWLIDGIEAFPNCNVEVYNRWGELLFQSPGYKDHWKGIYKNQLLPVGTYYYIIDLGDPLFPDAYTGPITIMR